MSKLSGEELANELERFVNGKSDKQVEAFINGFKRMHKTNQQSAFGLILKVVETMASDKIQVDGRNDASNKRAKMMVKGLKKEIIADLKEEDPYYWRDNKAEDFINSENYDISSLPLV